MVADRKSRLLNCHSSSPRVTTILIVDDHAIVRCALRKLLEPHAAFSVVGEAEDGESALLAVGRLSPDVALVDVAIPKLNGVELTKRIRDSHPATRVLALTAWEEEQYVRAALIAGAAGYIPKSAVAGDLIEAITVVAGGQHYVHPRVAHALIEFHPPAARGAAEGLSFRESEVLRLIALGYSGKEIAVRLEVSAKTVETYKARALLKLGITRRVEIVRYAQQRGWLDAASDDGSGGQIVSA